MSHRINIFDGEWIETDAKGFLLWFAEGALGCIAQVKCLSGVPWALKFPRMSGDTDIENFYIAQVFESEYRSLRSLWSVHGSQMPPGLIGAPRQGAGPTRVGVADAATAVRPSAAAELTRKLMPFLLLRFIKGQPPQLVSLRLSPGAIDADNFTLDNFEIEPATPEMRTELQNTLPLESLRELVLDRNGRPDPDDQLRCPRIIFGADSGESTIRLLRPETPARAGSSIRGGFTLSAANESPWYALAPSVMYNWGAGTLQRAISEGMLRTWGFEEFLALGCAIGKGIKSLHDARLIHADLRPANIMYLPRLKKDHGSKSGTLPEASCGDPKNYVLIDYCSFGDEWLVGTDSNPPENRTIVGPAARTIRASPFYAPERRLADEHESANAVIFLNPQHSTSESTKVIDALNAYRKQMASVVPEGGQSPPQGRGAFAVVIGWRESLECEDGKPHPAAMDVIEARLRHGVEVNAVFDRMSAGLSLAPGDRVRLRDYVVTVAGAPGELNGVVPVLDGPKLKNLLKVYSPNTAEGAKAVLAVEAANRTTLLVCCLPLWRVLHDRVVVAVEHIDEELSDGVKLTPIPRAIEIRRPSSGGDLFGLAACLLYTMLSINCDDEQLRKRDNDRLFADMMSTIESPTYFEVTAKSLRERCEEIERHAAAAGVTDYDPEEFARGLEEETELILAVTPGALHVYRACGSNAAHFLLLFWFLLRCIHRRGDFTATRTQAKDATIETRNAALSLNPASTDVTTSTMRSARVQDGQAEDPGTAGGTAKTAAAAATLPTEKEGLPGADGLPQSPVDNQLEKEIGELFCESRHEPPSGSGVPIARAVAELDRLILKVTPYLSELAIHPTVKSPGGDIAREPLQDPVRARVEVRRSRDAMREQQQRTLAAVATLNAVVRRLSYLEKWRKLRGRGIFPNAELRSAELLVEHWNAEENAGQYVGGAAEEAEALASKALAMIRKAMKTDRATGPTGNDLSIVEAQLQTCLIGESSSLIEPKLSPRRLPTEI